MWVKTRYPKWNSGQWTPGLNPEPGFISDPFSSLLSLSAVSQKDPFSMDINKIGFMKLSRFHKIHRLYTILIDESMKVLMRIRALRAGFLRIVHGHGMATEGGRAMFCVRGVQRNGPTVQASFGVYIYILVIYIYIYVQYMYIYICVSRK